MSEAIPLTDHVQEAVRAYAQPVFPAPPPEGVETVKVDQAMSRIAFVYEKVRNAVEYRETHLLRRAAIERILRRRWHENAPMEEISRALLRELIRARYLPNATYSEEVIGEVAEVLSRYHALKLGAVEAVKDKASRRAVSRFALELVASAVEAYLVPPLHVETLLASALVTYRDAIEFRGEHLTEAERDEQLYIALHHVLPQSDVTTIRFQLFLSRVPEWNNLASLSDAVIQETSTNLFALHASIEETLRHSVQERLQRKLRRQIAPYIVLRALLEKHRTQAQEVFSDPERFETEIRSVTEELYSSVKDRIRRSAVRSIIYLFLTKMIVGVLAEVPYDLYVFGEVHPIPLVINILFPPFLVFLIALWIRLPGEGNTQKIIQRLWGITYGAHGGDWVMVVRPPRGQQGVSRVLFVLGYIASLVVVYGGSAWLLRTYLDFTFVSIGIFLVFLSIVSFFGYRIRQSVRSLLTVQRRAGVFSLVFDFFSIPLLRVGRFLSLNFSRFDVLAFVLDVLLEAPFKTVVDYFEDWLSYMREKREELS